MEFGWRHAWLVETAPRLKWTDYAVAMITQIQGNFPQHRHKRADLKEVWKKRKELQPGSSRWTAGITVHFLRCQRLKTHQPASNSAPRPESKSQSSRVGREKCFQQEKRGSDDKDGHSITMGRSCTTEMFSALKFRNTSASIQSWYRSLTFKRNL